MSHFVPHSAGLEGRTLLNELNHRIKNEFASIINLVTFNAVWTDNSDAKQALSNVVDLLHHHVAVHSLLTLPDSDTLVDAGDEIRRLGLAMSRCRLERMKVRLRLSADSLPLEAERCWRLALAVYELLTNCAQHACFDNRDGEIKVELVRAGSWVNCRVSDNGSGLGRIKPGRGLRTVGELSASLGGRIDRTSGPMWNSFALAFPLTKREQRANRVLAARRPRTGRQVANMRSMRTADARSATSVPSLQPQV
jgi:two-component sensor histidine kinase